MPVLLKCLFLWIILTLFASCKLKTIAIRNDAGKVEERYQTLRKRQDIKHGTYKLFHENGQVAIEREYIKGEVDGEDRIYYENGQLESLARAEKGVYDGPFVYYYPDGTLKQEGTYIDNEIEGKLKTYYPNGQLKEVVTMQKTEENGAFVEYHENGKIKAEGSYKDGDNLHGLIKIYSSEGLLIRKKDCNLGNCEVVWMKYPVNQSPKKD